MEDRKFRIRNDLCFVIMPFTSGWSDRIYRIIRELVEEAGYECQRADDLYGRVVLSDIWQGLNEASFVIADLTDQNPNVYYELGLAHTLGKEIVPILQANQDIPFDQKPFRILFYEDNADGYQVLRSRLPSWIEQMNFATTPEMMLRRGTVADFNGWRRLHPLRSLNAEDLSGLDLTGIDLKEAHLTDANLKNSNLQQADLERATLIRSNLEGSNLIRAKMTRCNASEARLAGANLREADLRWSIVLRPDLTGADLTDADVNGMTIDHASHAKYEMLFAQCKNIAGMTIER
ncbi:MAG: pentapeptide repeat-containing protein [Pseudomonadota bacterium]